MNQLAQSILAVTAGWVIASASLFALEGVRSVGATVSHLEGVRSVGATALHNMGADGADALRQFPYVGSVGADALHGRFGGVLIETASFTVGVSLRNPKQITRAEGPGLAARYRADNGIEKDADVVFTEQFDEASIDVMKRRWESIGEDAGYTFSPDTPSRTPGDRSLQISHTGGKGAGGYLYRRLMPGFEKLFVRFYVKFAPDYGPNHHFFHVGGYNPPTPWAQGGAGSRPKGDERFTVGVEPFGDAWTWDYYAYWKRMRGSPPRGQTWGNTFIQNSELKVNRGQWTCMELMIKLNDVGDANGEMALWIDGKRVSHLGKGFPKGMWTFDRFFPGRGGEGITWNDVKGEREPLSFPVGGSPFEGFEWRSDEKLKINFLWVLNYITKSPQGHVSKVWFDNIVAAKQYIGPIGVSN